MIEVAIKRLLNEDIEKFNVPLFLKEGEAITDQQRERLKQITRRLLGVDFLMEGEALKKALKNKLVRKEFNYIWQLLEEIKEEK